MRFVAAAEVEATAPDAAELLMASAEVLFTSSMNWNGTWKLVPLFSTIKWPRRCEAPTTVTVSPFCSWSAGGLVAESSGKFIFITRDCG